MITELTPQRDSRKSFYGKAHIIQEDGKSFLQSYTTKVAVYDHSNGDLKVFGIHSDTTLRHIKEFIYQITCEVLTKSEIGKKYM